MLKIDPETGKPWNPGSREAGEVRIATAIDALEQSTRLRPLLAIHQSASPQPNFFDYLAAFLPYLTAVLQFVMCAIWLAIAVAYWVGTPA